MQSITVSQAVIISLLRECFARSPSTVTDGPPPSRREAWEIAEVFSHGSFELATAAECN